ncbi:transposase [Pseudoxanthomonas mexicana]
MSGKRYTDEFKAEAAKQVIDQDRSVREVATRLGISIDSLYAWVREQRKLPAARQGDVSLAVENRRLQAELKRVTEARDILKKAAAYKRRHGSNGGVSPVEFERLAGQSGL